MQNDVHLKTTIDNFVSSGHDTENDAVRSDFLYCLLRRITSSPVLRMRVTSSELWQHRHVNVVDMKQINSHIYAEMRRLHKQVASMKCQGKPFYVVLNDCNVWELGR